MMNLPTVQAPIRKKPLLLYLATNSYAIGALIAQEDEGGIEQPVYYDSRAPKDTEVSRSRIHLLLENKKQNTFTSKNNLESKRGFVNP